jgi:hypothetical protein
MSSLAGPWLFALWGVTLPIVRRLEAPGDGSKPRHITFSMLGVLFLFSLFLLASGRPILSTAASLAVTIVIGLASRVKYAHTLDSLTINDVRAALFQGGIAFLAATYRELSRKAALVAVTGISFVVFVGFVSPDFTVSYQTRLLVLLAAIVLAAAEVARRGPARLRRDILFSSHRGHFFSFLESVVMQFGPAMKFRMLDVGEVGAKVPPAVPDTGFRPHIILIHHESTFDPGIYGLPVTATVEEFLRPSKGISGRLKVDVFGGFSWMTEFAIQTGLSAQCFGSDARFIFRSGQDRFQHSFPAHLKRLGYRTVMANTMQRGFYNYSEFYRSIGIEKDFFSDDYAEAFRTEKLLDDHCDQTFYAAILNRLASEKDLSRLFLTVLTNFNHGPHPAKKEPAGLNASPRAFAMRSLGDAAYGDYFARLDFSARAYNRFKAEASLLLRGEPILFIRYGDHQPSFVAEVPALKRDPEISEKRHQTFYAIEALGFELDLKAAVDCQVLDATFLCTLAMKAAGLPLDPVYDLHFGLIAECGPGYFDAKSEAKRKYHRLLLDRGLVDATP